MSNFVSNHGQSLYAADGGRKYLNQAERERVFVVAATLPDDQALFLLTLAWTGARVSETLALTRGSFQADRGVVAISTLKRRRHHVREVPFPLDLMLALNRHFDLTTAELVDVRLWPWHRTTAWRLVKSAMRQSGVTGRPASPRGLRHGFGVGTLQAGVPLNLLQRWLGHARLSTTAIYADVSGPDERVFAERFWNRLESKSDPN